MKSIKIKHNKDILNLKNKPKNHNKIKPLTSLEDEKLLGDWEKRGLLPFLAPQTKYVLARHIDLTKGEDIPDIETMFRNMKEGNDGAYGDFNEFTSTLFASYHYDRKLDELTRAAYPTIKNKMEQLNNLDLSECFKEGSPAHRKLKNNKSKPKKRRRI